MTEGGSAASEQIGLETGSRPSAYGISPARGEKGTYSKVSARGEKRSFSKVSSRVKLPNACPALDAGAEGVRPATTEIAILPFR